MEWDGAAVGQNFTATLGMTIIISSPYVLWQRNVEFKLILNQIKNSKKNDILQYKYW